MRKPRLVVPGNPHHAILRGNNKRTLFSYPNDYYRFINYLAEGLEKYACVMHSLVLMTNHVHMLLTPQGLDDMSKVIHHAAMKYAQHRNRTRGGTGKVYEGHFRSFPVLSEGQLAIVSAYIDNNPVRARMCRAPTEYRYSTYGLHVGAPGVAIPSRIWTPTAWYLSLSTSDFERQDRYREWVGLCEREGRKPDKVELIDYLEAVSNRGPDPWLRRPNGTRASERLETYVGGPLNFAELREREVP
jgi:putative transposase